MHILGIDVKRKIVIVGAGNIGNRPLPDMRNLKKKAIACWRCLIIGPKVIGTEINGKKVYDIESLPDYIVKNDIDIVALTVPAKFAQQIAYISQKAGAKAIWNFAPGRCRAWRYTGGKYTSYRFAYDSFIQACKHK